MRKTLKQRVSRVLTLLLSALLLITNTTNAYDINTDEPMADKSQVTAFLADRNTSDSFLNSIDYIYEYSKQIGIDPVIVIAMSAYETGYGHSHLFKYYNNPGGIKGTGGWRRFDTLEDGYRYMIRLLGKYSGKVQSNSWIFNKADTTEELGNYYWVENGVDRGYHKQLSIIIEQIKSYPADAEPETETKKETPLINQSKSTKPTGLDLIKNRLNNSNVSYGLKMIFTKLKN